MFGCGWGPRAQVLFEVVQSVLDHRPVAEVALYVPVHGDDDPGVAVACRKDPQRAGAGKGWSE